MLDINLYNYHLPEGRIAIYPAEPRDSSKLMHLPRKAGEAGHYKFSAIDSFIRQGDIIVLNDSRVFPARIFGNKVGSKGKIEIFLLTRNDDNSWQALVRPGKRIPSGTTVEIFNGESKAIIGERTSFGGRIINFEANGNLMDLIWEYGEIPLPPYIDRKPEDADKTRYQTIYAENTGAVAAPTAGFHFTDEVLQKIKNKGAEVVKLTLHPGLGTFRPITVQDIENHQMHSERFTIPNAAADVINQGKTEARRIIAVGTTTVRALESAVDANGNVTPTQWTSTELFIKPPYEFKVINGLITNFHLPKSTLLVMISAFAGRERILEAYQAAIEKGYRFYSYGDAMIII